MIGTSEPLSEISNPLAKVPKCPVLVIEPSGKSATILPSSNFVLISLNASLDARAEIGISPKNLKIGFKYHFS